jgi:sigma-54 dependent transcriptional regulator, acetoin dehydrogenase operon transcriptional activator AcoR
VGARQPVAANSQAPERHSRYVAAVPGDTRTMQPIASPPLEASSAGLLLLYADPLDAPSMVRLVESPVILGRDPPPHGVRLNQSAASRMHARLTRRGAEWTLLDLGSRNGTFVEGRRITGEVVLRDGSVMRIGDALFKFVLQGVEAYAPYRVDGSLVPGAQRLSDRVPELVGGLSMDRIAASIEAVARTDLALIVRGETGTGKELVAHAIHRLSERTGGLCAVNCAAVPASLFESELFGFRKGAFTGADRDKRGLVQAADGGTLFLDEIGDMPFESQAKLLRVLEAHEVRAIGATETERVDVRVVAATHKDLARLVEEGRFRSDLFARLRGYEITLPPLRARKEDLYSLVRHFLEKAGRPDLGLTFGFMLTLCDYDWPYNVRECELTVRRVVAVAKGPALSAQDLPDDLREHTRDYGHRQEPKEGTERVSVMPERGGAVSGPPTVERLRALLDAHGGNIAAVARALGKDRAQVHRWLRRHGIFRSRPPT